MFISMRMVACPLHANFLRLQVQFLNNLRRSSLETTKLQYLFGFFFFFEKQKDKPTSGLSDIKVKKIKNITRVKSGASEASSWHQ